MEIVATSAVHTVTTPVGPARVTVDAAPAPRLTLALGHGAGGGIAARDLVALARALPSRGITVVRVEQPWRVAGRRVATAPPTLDVAWVAVLGELKLRPVVVGGRSAGARVACRTATRVGALGCVGLAFPLHPPGRPDQSRLAELAAAGVPTLVVQGERDAFGRAADFPVGYDVRAIPAADHSFRVPKGHNQRAVLDELAETVADWILQLEPGNRGTSREV